MKKIQRALISATATVVKAQFHHSKVHGVDYSNLCNISSQAELKSTPDLTSAISSQAELKRKVPSKLI